MRGKLSLTFLLISSLLAVNATASPAINAQVEDSYQRARVCYYELLESKARQGRRDQWEECIKRFALVRDKFPRSQRAADSQYSLGKTYEQLFQASHNREDLKSSISAYKKLARRYPKSSLADDALYRAGVVYWEGFKDKNGARAMMNEIIKWHKTGDKIKIAERFLRELKINGNKLALKNGLLAITPGTSKISATRNTNISSSSITSEFPTDRKFYIVIDPGHGGKDPGAIGPKGTQEKQVTLAISKKLARELQQRIPSKVTLTRYSDLFIDLGERNEFANKRKSDLFISIHANASENKDQHGIQTYYLNNASDEASKRLATRENSMAGKSRTDLDLIMSTMLQNAFTDESRQLAQNVHSSLIKELGGKYTNVNDQKVRSALFYVLVGAKSPAILVETSYVTNPREEARLSSNEYQDSVARAIADGVIKFLQTHKSSETL